VHNVDARFIKYISKKMDNYDEDLHENHFFKALAETSNALYSKAADNKWLVSKKAPLKLIKVM